MNFISWSVKGLTDPAQKYLIYSEIAKVTQEYGKMDFLCLQEVKIFDFNLECASAFLCPDNTLYAIDHCQHRGGAITLVLPKWNS